MTSILNSDDMALLLKAQCHRGSEKILKGMSPYVYKKASDGKSHIFDLFKTWQKIHAAARMLVAVKNPKDICLVSSTNWGQRSIFKFSQYTETHSISGRFTPGTFTNRICKNFREPSVLIVCDPTGDSQPIKEASYVNVPVIACCDTDSPLKYVDLAIPCNNKSKFSVAAVLFLLCREVLRMQGKLSPEEHWDIPVDLFIFKEADELEELISKDKAELEKRRLKKEAEREKESEKDSVPAEPLEEDSVPAGESSAEEREESLTVSEERSVPEKAAPPVQRPAQGEAPAAGSGIHNTPVLEYWQNPQQAAPQGAPAAPWGKEFFEQQQRALQMQAMQLQAMQQAFLAQQPGGYPPQGGIPPQGAMPNPYAFYMPQGPPSGRAPPAPGRQQPPQDLPQAQPGRRQPGRGEDKR